MLSSNPPVIHHRSQVGIREGTYLLDGIPVRDTLQMSERYKIALYDLRQLLDECLAIDLLIHTNDEERLRSRGYAVSSQSFRDLQENRIQRNQYKDGAREKRGE